MNASLSSRSQAAPATGAAWSTRGYRLDLDGLRGIAIALVAIFHVWFGKVSGGVDVFLTLSGYFFVASLLKHVLATNAAEVGWAKAVNPLPRLWRLARRLLPGLLLVLVAITGLVALLMPSSRLQGLASELRASALYYQNWQLALNSQDYTAANAGNSPLQHLWSMSVQGQFFVSMILIAMLLGGALRLLALATPLARRRGVIMGSFAALITAGAIASFLWANHRVSIDQPFNYYDTFARAWQPLIGGLLAIGLLAAADRDLRLALPTWLRNSLGIAALALIISCGWWIDGVDSYPGPLALVPVGATLLLIWTGSPAARSSVGATPGAISNLLAHPRLVWLGSIAYALYLWHWPLLIFYLAWTTQSSVNWFEGSAILVISIILAWLTTRYVEAPLRAESSAPKDPVELATTERAAAATKASQLRGWVVDRTRLRRRLLVVALTVATAASGITVSMWQHSAANARVDTASLDPADYPGARAFLDHVATPDVAPMPPPEFAYLEWPVTSRDRNFSGFTDGSIRMGEYGDTEATRTMALVGGSHSEQWITALDAIGKQRNFRVTTYLKAGCPLITTHHFTWKGQPYTQCNEWSRAVMDRLVVDAPDVVFTVGTRPAFEGAGDFIPTDYIEIFDQWRMRGQRVVAVRDNPRAVQPMSPPDCIDAGGTPEDCGVPRDVALNPVDPQQAIMGFYPNMSFLDYTDAMCTATVCPAVVGNVLLWHDHHHLTETYVRTLIPAMDRDLGPMLGWW